MALVEARHYATRARLDVSEKLLNARLAANRAKTKAEKTIWSEHAAILSDLLDGTVVPPLGA